MLQKVTGHEKEGLEFREPVQKQLVTVQERNKGLDQGRSGGMEKRLRGAGSQ